MQAVLQTESTIDPVIDWVPTYHVRTGYDLPITGDVAIFTYQNAMWELLFHSASTAIPTSLDNDFAYYPSNLLTICNQTLPIIWGSHLDASHPSTLPTKRSAKIYAFTPKPQRLRSNALEMQSPAQPLADMNLLTKKQRALKFLSSLLEESFDQTEIHEQELSLAETKKSLDQSRMSARKLFS